MSTNPLGVGFKVKDFFFDSKKVINATDPKERKFLSKFGAFVWRGAKSSIKSAGKKDVVSQPGEPPRSHNGRLKKNIFFFADLSGANKNVIIGPIILPGVIGGADALEALEYSGSTTIESFVKGQRKKKRVNIAARPFMTPAFEAEKKNISSIWRSA